MEKLPTIFFYTDNQQVVSYASFINQVPCYFYTQSMVKSKVIYIHFDNLMSLNLQSHDKAQLSYKTRFSDGVGTNPKELLGSAHAGCFSMQFGFLLNEAGFTAENIDTNAKVVFEDSTITKINLESIATIIGISEEKFQETALAAKAKYPISRLLNTEISLTATLA